MCPDIVEGAKYKQSVKDGVLTTYDKAGKEVLTKLEDIIFTVGRTGQITPIAIFKTLKILNFAKIATTKNPKKPKMEYPNRIFR